MRAAVPSKRNAAGIESADSLTLRDLPAARRRSRRPPHQAQVRSRRGDYPACEFPALDRAVAPTPRKPPTPILARQPPAIVRLRNRVLVPGVPDGLPAQNLFPKNMLRERVHPFSTVQRGEPNLRP